MLKLKHVLDAKGMTMKGSAELLGMSQKSLYNKIVGVSEFTYGEVQKLRLLLPEYNVDFLMQNDQDSA